MTQLSIENLTDSFIQSLSRDYLEWARQLHNDPEVLSVLTDPHQISESEQERWFNKLQISSSSERLLVFYRDEPIGLIRLDEIDYFNKSVAIGLDIHKDYRGQGLARPIYQRILKYFFEEKDFHRVWLLVTDYNKRAINLYHSLGFIDEGCKRQSIYRDGKFYNYYMMSILKDEYLSRLT